MNSPTYPSGLTKLVQEYHDHLLHTAGLARQTCAQRVRYASRFQRAYRLSSRSRLGFRKLNASWLLRYVLRLSAEGQPRTLQCQVSTLRSFLRFLALTGRAPIGLGQALPTIRRPRTVIEHYLSRSQLRNFLGAFDADLPAGVRDYAMALLAAQLGLRAQEIARLTLADVDWKAGTLCLHQTKGRRSRLLPLPSAAGQAMAHYLRTVRAPSPARQVFLCLYRPRPLTAGAVSDAMVAAFGRAGLKVSRPGAHLLRHTLATHLVQRGASLKAIADVLGHRSINTTTLYAKVNLPMLVKISQPWPEAER